jgi:uncharacterized protein YkwD
MHMFAAVAAISALALLVGCKGGDSCKKDFAEPTAGTGSTLPPAGGGTGSGTTPPSGGSTGGDPAPTDDRGELLELINDARQRQGLSQLLYDSRMGSVAQNYAEYCAAQRAYSATLSGTPSSRLRGGGVTFNQCAETGVYIDTVTLFINSEVFKKMDQSKLMNPAYGRIGIGYGKCHYS